MEALNITVYICIPESCDALVSNHLKCTQMFNALNALVGDHLLMRFFRRNSWHEIIARHAAGLKL